MVYLIAKLAAIAFVCFIFTLKLRSQYGEENGERNEPSSEQRYRPFFYGMRLPSCLLILLIVDGCFNGLTSATHALLSSCFTVFLQIIFYYAILLCILPLVRNRITARSCAFLWTMPNYLYMVVLYFDEANMPFFILPMRSSLLLWILGIWSLGFISVMAWQIFSHLHYRNYVLKEALPVTDSEILEIWKHEINYLRMENIKNEVWISPNISTPMTIGLFKKTMKVVLPIKTYAPDDLSLIFRHELVHISREDSLNKFFLVFCTAMCWFNPLMWIASKKCAEDLELSCDETVLIYANQNTKQRYAELILKTAGDERGFTSCLSVKAKALHYRLKNILTPKKQSTGLVLIGIIGFLLVGTCGQVSLAYNYTTISDLILEHGNTDSYEIYSIEERVQSAVTCSDEEALLKYLDELSVCRLTGEYSFYEDMNFVNIYLSGANNVRNIVLTDHLLTLYVNDGNNVDFLVYYLPDGVDWNYLDLLLNLNNV